MSLAALRADSCRWEALELLGRALKRAKSDSGDAPAYYDVNDGSREKPLVVLDAAVRGPFPSDALRKIWRLSTAALPSSCRCPLWLPADVVVAREVAMPAHIIINDSSRIALRSAPEEFKVRLRNLRPQGTLKVCWTEPLVRVSVPSCAQTFSQAYVGSVILGPMLQVTLHRNAAGILELAAFEGGPAGTQDIAAELFRSAIDEVEAAKKADEEEQARIDRARLIKREKVVFVFGKAFRPSDNKRTDDVFWDFECESFVFWSALQQWQRTTRRQPWRWCLQWIETDGSHAVTPSSTRGDQRITLPSSPKSSGSRTPKRNVFAPRLRCNQDGKSDGFRALLRGFDKDRSDSVDWPEFKECSKKIVNLLGIEGNWTEEAARQEFEALDTNGNGVIEEEEWLAFVGDFLSLLKHADLQRILYFLGEDMSAFTTRTLSMVRGDVDIGLTCKKGHMIRPLPLKPWGEHLAKSLGLTCGFRCAEVDDPTAFAAACRQRCTRCNGVESQATFIVTCASCGTSFPSGWWCTRCVLKAGRLRDRRGCCVTPLHRHRQGNCKYCTQPAIVAWPDGVETDALCNEHAAHRLLEEATRCSVAAGRELEEGPSLAISVSLRLKLEHDEEDDEDTQEIARSLESELYDALNLEGAPPEHAQLEVTEIRLDQAQPLLRNRSNTGGKHSHDSSGAQTVVQLVLLRAFGRPSPYELFLRLRSLAVDPEGPLYSNRQYQLLGLLADSPQLTDAVVTEPVEQVEMTSRVAQVVAESWPHATCESQTVIVARPPRRLLPRAAIVALHCVRPPPGSEGRLTAYALAYAAGAKTTAPHFYEFNEYFNPQSPKKPHTETKPKIDSGKHEAKRNSSAKAQPRKDRKEKKVKKGSVESGCAVHMRCGAADDLNMLEGEATIFGLKPDREYDIYVAVFAASRNIGIDCLEADYQEPVAVTKQRIRTCAVSGSCREFGADCDGIVQLQTEEPHVSRKSGFLELLGIAGAPCVIDQNTCKLTWEASKGSKDAVEEHGIKVQLDAAEPEIDNPAAAGGLQLPAPTLLAEPSYLEGRAELTVTTSADVVIYPCPKHAVPGWRPPALSLNGAATEAWCCKPHQDNSRCEACRFKKIEHTERVQVQISIDVVRMAEMGDWHSVQKRVQICHPQQARGAVAVMLNTRPQLEAGLIMQIFEGAVGRGHDTDFPVRLDGANALHIAVEENHLEAAKSLLRRKMDPSVTNSSGETPLHSAARGGNGAAQDVIEMLLDAARSPWRGDEHVEHDKQVARQRLLDKQDERGRTVLHWAALADLQPLTRYLLKAKADHNLCDFAGRNALHVAAAAGGVNSAIVLLTVVDVGGVTRGPRGYTALHFACERCKPDLAMALIQRKADPRTVVEVDGQSKHSLNLFLEALARWAHYEGAKGTLELAQCLIKKGKPSKDAISQAGASLCDLALWATRNPEVRDSAEGLVALLAENGLELSSALGVALLNSVSVSASRPLADDRRNEERVAQAQTPGAAALDLPEVVALALRLGASVNTTDKARDTALHLLVRLPSQCRILPQDQVTGEAVAKTIRLLIEHKADPKLVNKKGDTPISLARSLRDMGDQYSLAWHSVLAGGGEYKPPSRPSGNRTTSKTSSSPRSKSRDHEPLPAISPRSDSRESAAPMLMGRQQSKDSMQRKGKETSTVVLQLPKI